MTCRGCDTPIDSDTYCKRCLEEIESLISAKPFVWSVWFWSQVETFRVGFEAIREWVTHPPLWVRIVRDTLLTIGLILLVCYCVYLGIIDIADGSI